MVWQSYDRQNIIFDEPMAEQLSQYLENKESQLSAKIIEIILHIEGLPITKESLPPSFFRLSEAVEEFGRKIHRASLNSYKVLNKDRWRFAAKEINQALWSYVEVLEGCVTELFQQIDQMGFEQWNVDVIRATTSIKDELTHRMDDLVWAIRRLEQQLKNYRKLCDARAGKWLGFRKLFYALSPLLDRQLEPTVRKCNKFLNFQYRKFIERYTGYLQLCETGKQSINKFSDYHILSSLDISQQDKFKELTFLLNLWENNCKGRVLQRTEPVRALRSCLSFEGAAILFKDYFYAIKEAIYNQSRLIKKQFRYVFVDEEAKQPLVDNLSGIRKELGTLKELILNYKKFHTHTDPGAKPWYAKIFACKPEKELPKQFYDLKKLTQEIKNLETVATSFQSTLQTFPGMDKGLTVQLQNEVNRHLHEMGQPLASKDLMRRNAKSLMHSLEGLDEISTFDPKIVEFICRTLSKAMCADWKYHVLQELPVFHKVYEVHEGILDISSERPHINRLHKFQRILNQLETWLKNEETLKHSQGVDLDIHDIKAYLQDFLAHVQRLEPDIENFGDTEKFERPLGKASQALLQYLYLFGSFFSRLRPDDPEHRLLRKQLLFIDQYFEAIERRIQELGNPNL